MEEYYLHYSRSAEKWEEALPLGNGRIGAMVFGRIGKEIVRMNEKTLWEGEPHVWDNPETREHLQEIRTLIFQGEYAAAAEKAERYSNAWITAMQTACTVPFVQRAIC